MNLQTLALILGVLGLVLGRKSYEGHKVFQIDLKAASDIKLIDVFQKNNAFDFWTKRHIIQKPAVVKVLPNTQRNFEKYLKRHNLSYNILIEDVETSVQREFTAHAKKSGYKAGRITFDQYYRHSEINAYLDDLEASNPGIVRTQVIGQSYENRDLKLVHIGTEGEGKPTIFIDAGIHAQEWIAPAVALYIINQLVENPNNQNLIEDVNWTILPSLNPDGYEYSWNEDRFWRKTRSIGSICDGVDPNRNFDFHWMEGGASDDECSEIYAGLEPFTEKETQALRDYLLSSVLLSEVAAYLTFHSYGQSLMYPWGYNSDLPANWQELDDLGNAVSDAIKAVRGTEYAVGSSFNLSQSSAAGASDDWSMGVTGIPIVYTIELPGGGSAGFDLPESEIRGVVVETWQGILVFHNYIAEGTN